MSLSQTRYRSILESYQATREQNLRERDARREEVYTRIPRYRELDLAIPDIALAIGKAKIAGDTQKASELSGRFQQISEEKRSLLLSHDYPEDYTDVHYTCKACEDTGYAEGRRCTCLKEKIASILYEQSHLAHLIRDNNFSVMRDDYYTGEDLHRFHAAVEICRDFLLHFNEEDRPDGILFFGSVGTGKSFLSICMAEQLLQQGAHVLYFSAIGLFDRMGDAAFRKEENGPAEDFFEDLADCDLLVIDDLGTELTNAFVSTRLFQLINERHLNKKATVISTNFDLDELRARYSDRVFSRLVTGYRVCELTGRDIRLLQKTL